MSDLQYLVAILHSTVVTPNSFEDLAFKLMIFQKSSTQCMQLVTITLTTQLIVIIESREVSATNLSPEALMLEYHPSYAFYEQWEQLFQIDEEVSNVNNDPFIGCFAFFAWVKH